MGYYTRYSVTYDVEEHNNPVYFEVIQQGLTTVADNDYNPFDDACKWYGWEDDMKRFSKKHPKVMFEVHGEGEESGDVWKAYIKNGKVQLCKAELVFPKFNEKEMK